MNAKRDPMPIGVAGTRRIGRITAAVLLFGLASQANAREPFRLATVPALGPISVTWHKLQAQMEAECPLIARCRATPPACRSIPALQFIAIVDQGKAFEGLARIGHINRAVNLSIRPVDTRVPAGRRYKWTWPLAALAAGEGDCKQCAVLKYRALQASGFAADDVRIVIMERRRRPETHAMVAVLNDGRWLILDDRSLAIIESRMLLVRNRPLYVLGWRRARRFVPQPHLTADKCVGVGGG